MYIGSSNQIRRRLWDHLSQLKRNVHVNGKLQNAFNKYSSEDFIIGVLEFTSHDLLEREEFWMRVFNTVANGLNIHDNPQCPPSRAGIRHTDETKLKMSLSRKGVPKTEEHKNQTIRKPRPCTEETRAKLRKIATGRRHSEESRKKMSKASAGRLVSEATCRKISESKRGIATTFGENHPFWGTKRPLETRLKISESLKRRAMNLAK